MTTPSNTMNHETNPINEIILTTSLESFRQVVGPRINKYRRTREQHSDFFDSGTDVELTNWVLVNLSNWTFPGGIKEINNSKISQMVKALYIDDGTCFGPKACLMARELFGRWKDHPKDPAQWKGELKFHSKADIPEAPIYPQDRDTDVFEREHEYMNRLVTEIGIGRGSVIWINTKTKGSAWLTNDSAFTKNERSRFNLIMRGITRKTYEGDENKFKNPNISDETRAREANLFGNNDIALGTWWPYRVCAMRDGAHSVIEAGIVGNETTGAYSIVISSGGPLDSEGSGKYTTEDHGNVFWYQSTFGAVNPNGSDKFSTGAGALKTSLETGRPVRVIRGKDSTIWAPCRGYRYDGLYTVTRVVLIRNEKGKPGYKCLLKRKEGQELLSDIFARSPEILDIAVFKKMKQQIEAKRKR
ncbi:PUA-like domain-containing protein [Geopyxis carbonaria]|nr:PUA-like domain-containing protein [Geopyxis carbonaria]